MKPEPKTWLALPRWLGVDEVAKDQVALKEDFWVPPGEEMRKGPTTAATPWL
jgi:hypothetical protein